MKMVALLGIVALAPQEDFLPLREGARWTLSVWREAVTAPR